MQLKIKYWLFSFLILFTAMNNTLAEPCIVYADGTAATKPVSKHTIIQESTTDPASLADYNYCLTDFFLSNTHTLQTGAFVASKRVQSDKDLLLLHAVNYSKTVKISSCYDVKFTDNLTHIYLFLFPYHFFW